MRNNVYRKFFLLILVFLPMQGWSADLQSLKAQYQSGEKELKRHIVDGQWIDDNPETPGMLAQQWHRAGDWVATWLNTHPSDVPQNELKAALLELAPSETFDYLELSNTAFLVEINNPLGNVFIVAKTGGKYRLAWSIATQQETKDNTAGILAAWQAQNAVHGGRGAYWAASGKAGPLSAQLGSLPTDANGHARFYINGSYAQSAGTVIGMQTSLWVWNGITAHPQFAKNYAVTLEQKTWTRLEGDLLKVQQRQSFRTFFTTNAEEERQVDWIVQITPNEMTDKGDKVVVPELDAADELFYRLIKGEAAADIAAPKAIGAAKDILLKARGSESDKEWNESPLVGELFGWKVISQKNYVVLCLLLNNDAYRLRLKPQGGSFYIEDIQVSKNGCSE